MSRSEPRSFLWAQAFRISTAVVLYFAVQGYARLVSRYERTRLITIVTSIFIACLAVFWILNEFGIPYLSYVFFVWIGMFSVMVVAQFRS